MRDTPRHPSVRVRSATVGTNTSRTRLPHEISVAIAECSLANRDCALVRLVEARGSTPAKRGAWAIVDGDGGIIGTIGGGALEAHAQRNAIEAIQAGEARVLDFSLDGPGPAVPEPICGGRLRVLVDPTATRNQEVYARCSRVRQQGGRGLLVTTIRTSAVQTGPWLAARVSVDWLDESSVDGWAGHPSAAVLRRVLSGGAVEYFRRNEDAEGIEALVETVAARPQLLIVGGGHVGQALAAQATLVGFDIIVIDDRAEFTKPELFPLDAETRFGPLREELLRFPFRQDTYIALVTRGHTSDAEALRVCLTKPHAYLGMIGSRRKVDLMRAAFFETGRATPDQWDRIHAPIGFDIGAVTVPEIAASIVAQLIAVRRTGGTHATRATTDEGRCP